jgi:hypothetical protein
MLAYVFWHRPAGPLDAVEYEHLLAAFHDRLAAVSPPGFVESAAFRVRAQPWLSLGGYEDWYVVDDWTALGVLNDATIDAEHRTDHDAVARRSSDGAGAVYRLLSGGLPLADAGAARWSQRRPGDLPGEDEFALWQRQLVLGPAPEFCLRERGSDVVCVTCRSAG